MAKTEVISVDEFMESGLDSIREHYPSFIFDIRKDIKQGDVIKKSSGLAYSIDDIETALSFVGFNGEFPYRAIHNRLTADASGIYTLFQNQGTLEQGKRALPFSVALREKVGECLEKAILSHLVLQSMPNVENRLLVCGQVSDREYTEPHAYNLAKKNGSWVLIDTQNPRAVFADGKVIPFIVPINGVNMSNSLLPLEFDDKERTNRDYFLRL